MTTTERKDNYLRTHGWRFNRLIAKGGPGRGYSKLWHSPTLAPIRSVATSEAYRLQKRSERINA